MARAARRKKNINIRREASEILSPNLILKLYWSAKTVELYKENTLSKHDFAKFSPAALAV